MRLILACRRFVLWSPAEARSRARPIIRQRTRARTPRPALPWQPHRSAARRRPQIMHERHEGMEAIGKAMQSLHRQLDSANPDINVIRAADVDDGLEPAARSRAGSRPEPDPTSARPAPRPRSGQQHELISCQGEGLCGSGPGAQRGRQGRRPEQVMALHETSIRPARPVTTRSARPSIERWPLRQAAASGTCRCGSFHWLLAALIAFSWWSAEYDHTDWHIWSGIVILTLLVFRLLWGFFGSSTARFASFVRGPGAVCGYLRGDWTRDGPYAARRAQRPRLVRAVAVQVGLGLFAEDEDGLYAGTARSLVSIDTSDRVRELHATWFYVLLGVIALHVAAILFYRVRGGKS